VLLHSTDVITFKPNGETVLYTGGYDTHTTWDRINSYQKYGCWSERGMRTVRDNEGIAYLFKASGTYYHRGDIITIKADGSIDGIPFYANTVQSITGQVCTTKEQMLSIIRGLDKITAKKLMGHVRIDSGLIGQLCLRAFTGKETIEEGLATLTPEELWFVWRRGSWNIRHQIRPYLYKVTSKITFDLAWKMWLRVNDEILVKKIKPRLIKEISVMPLNKIERMWKTTGYIGKIFIAQYCTKDFLPLIMHEKINRPRRRWGQPTDEISNIAISRLAA
jgi:hypothetical protein